MDGSAVENEVTLDLASINHLMPMHLCLSPGGHIVSAGLTLSKLFPNRVLTSHRLFDLFEVRRPGGIANLADLAKYAGRPLFLGGVDSGLPAMRGVALPRSKGQGWLLNLSFGIGVIEAVRQHALTDADFAPTDLTVELLYLVEAKSAVMEELRNLNLRLQGAKLAAEEQALTDTLTGLRNRRALDREMADHVRRSIPFCLMHIDLDYFKAVNDTLGHAAGDHVLQQVAHVLCAETRKGDTVARIGGDEFVVVLPHLDDPSLMQQIANRIIARLSVPMAFEGQPCQISGSIGMTLSNFYSDPNPQQMQTDADEALYTSKRGGRARASLYSLHEGHDPRAHE